MKRLTAFLLVLILLLQGVPAIAAAEAAPAAEPLTAGLYYSRNGDYLYLAETSSVRSGYLVQKTDEGAYYHGIVWFEDTLIIEMTYVSYTYESGVLRFSFYGRDHELVFDPTYPAGLGYEGVPGTLDLSGAVVRSADGTVVSFSEDGSGVLARPGSDPVPLIWGSITESATQATDFIVTLSYLSGVTYENGILSFRTDDNTAISASPATRTDIEGTEVISPEFNFRVILSSPDWTVNKEEQLYSFVRNDNLAYISLYNYNIGNFEAAPDDIDEGLSNMISQLDGKQKGEYYNRPVAGLLGRGVDFIYNNQLDFDCTEIIFVAGEYAYYLTVMELGEFTEDTLQVMNDMIDSFTFAQ